MGLGHSALKGNKKLILALAGITLVGVVILNYFHSNDLANQVGFIGLCITIWQIMEQNSATEAAAQQAKVQQIFDLIASVQRECEERDHHHDKLINQLRQDFTEKIGIFATQMDNHSNQFGHAGTIEELFDLKDKVSEVQAALMVYTRMGETSMAISQLQIDNAQMQKDIEKLKSKSEG